jgi:hypothetical protein
MAAVIGALAWHGIEYSLDQRLFYLGNGERRSVAVGNYIVNTLPARAVFLSMYHSGSIRYYSARLTVRYDWIPEDHLDAVISDLRHLGYHPYLVLEDWEEAQFRARFQGHSALAALNWPPVAWVDTPIKTKIYDPADAQMPGSNRRVTTATIR